MENKHFISKMILICAITYFTISGAYLYHAILPIMTEEPAKAIVQFMVVQNGTGAVVLILGGTFYYFLGKIRTFASPFRSLKVLSSEGKYTEEIPLKDRRSLFIARKNRDGISIDNKEIRAMDQEPYAVLNLVSGHWYIEAIGSQCPVGLRKEDQGVVYKLRPNIPYKLSAKDIIYVDKNKIIIDQ